MKDEVQKVLDEVRPSLQADGGNVELIDVDEKTGRVPAPIARCPP
jgi:Fe-S cluster biogenesis protein NfuA